MPLQTASWVGSTHGKIGEISFLADSPGTSLVGAGASAGANSQVDGVGQPKAAPGKGQGLPPSLTHREVPPSWPGPSQALPLRWDIQPSHRREQLQLNIKHQSVTLYQGVN